MSNGDSAKRRKPMAVAIAMWTAVGIVLNVGVSLGCAIGDVRNRASQFYACVMRADYESRRIGEQHTWVVSVPTAWPTGPDGVWESGGWGWTHVNAFRRDKHDPLSPQPIDEKWATECRRYGLPLRAMEWSAYQHEGRTTFGETLVQSPHISSRWLRRTLDIELIPAGFLWPGFALNTIFYAALTFALCQLPLALRRHRRRARNQCPRCGYALTGLPSTSPCPECGSYSAK